MQNEVRMILSCAIRTIALPMSKQRRSLNPAASASNNTVVEYLATVSPELELANGSLCKAWFWKLEKAATYLATAENIKNELQEKFVLCVFTRSCARLPTSSHIITRSAI